MPVALFPYLFITACNRERPPTEVASTPEASAPAPSVTTGAVGTGTVVETMNSGGYTYVQVDTGSKEIWAAAPESLVKVGDQVAIPEGMPMRNFHSKTLDRDFELIYFVTSLRNPAGDPLAKVNHTPTGDRPTAGHPAVGSPRALRASPSRIVD